MLLRIVKYAKLRWRRQLLEVANRQMACRGLAGIMCPALLRAQAAIGVAYLCAVARMARRKCASSHTMARQIFERRRHGRKQNHVRRREAREGLICKHENRGSMERKRRGAHVETMRRLSC